MSESCETCRCWQNLGYPTSVDWKLGNCRRHAPVIGQRDDFAQFPKVQSTNWCGDYVLSEAPQQKQESTD